MSQRSVVWLTLESVQAGNTSVCGYDRTTTPNLERIADSPRGRVHDDCYAGSIWTPASSATMLTGTHLFEHRVGYDGTADRPLPEQLRTLPGLLRDRGYRTACLTPNAYLSDATGLDRGFDRHHLLTLRGAPFDPETRRATLSYLRRLRSYGPGFSPRLQLHNKTYLMWHTVDRWLDELADDAPFFLYVHVPNPHLPYTPPRTWRDRFTDDLTHTPHEALDLSLELYDGRERMIEAITDGLPFSAAEWDAIEAMYDAEIAYADECVGRVFDRLQTVADDPIVVVTGDHGDLFGEHGLVGHNLVLDDRLTNVPLVTHGLSFEPDGVVGHVDVTRTVAERLGVSHDQFSGTDLRVETPTAAVSQRGIAQFDEYLSADAGFDTGRYHTSPVSALRTDRFKLVASDDRVELFDPPDEEHDVSDAHPDVRDRLEERLSAALDRMEPQTTDREATYTPEMRQQLSDLGYL